MPPDPSPQSDLDRQTAAVRAELDRYGDELLPGASERLASLWRGLGVSPPDVIAEKVAENLALPHVQRFKNGERAAPKLENGVAPSPLRLALARHASTLKPGAVEALYAQWAADLAGKTPAQIAGHVARRLASRDVAESYSLNPPAPPRTERWLAAVILANYPEWMNQRDAIARHFAREMGHDSNAVSVVKRLAESMKFPTVAAKLGVDPIKPDDRRLNPLSRDVAVPEGFEIPRSAKSLAL